MEYVIGHIGPILIGALIVGALGAIWAVASMKWAELQKAEGEAEETPVDCGMGCNGCSMMSNCGKAKQSE